MIRNIYKYRIFDCVLSSSIELPELPPFQGAISLDTIALSFTLKDATLAEKQDPEWFHHWHLQDGRVSLSCGKSDNSYYMRFPGMADFQISVTDNTIICFPANDVDPFTLRHLLLDQVVPRLLSHQGQMILHASAVCWKNEAMLFLGESGQGKSTIAMALRQYGCTLLTDDCVSLKIVDGRVHCIVNYIGARLWADSITALDPQSDQLEKFGESGKSRLYFNFDKKRELPIIPVKAVFFLGSVENKNTTDCCSCTPLTWTDRLMEMSRHCFPLDITDQSYTRRSFENVSRIGQVDNILFASLCYVRDYALLPGLCETVLAACTKNLHGKQGQ